ncbi:hypothetical protein HK101_011685, partial [Irineochytrium annulatum]
MTRAFLSGFGAVNTPYTTLFIFLKGVTSDDVSEAERELEGVHDMIATKQRRITELQRKRSMGQQQQQQHQNSGVDFMGGFVRRMVSTVSTGLAMGLDEINTLAGEIRTLEMLSQKMTSELESLQAER